MVWLSTTSVQRAEPVGCSFAPRCKFAFERCHKEVPPLEADADGRVRACFVPIRGGEVLE